MVTAAEIRARVEEADRARIQVRADAAEKVATALALRTEAAKQLVTAEANIAAAIGEAGAVMTLDELAEFTDEPVREFRRLNSSRIPQKRRASSRRRKPAETRVAAPSAPAQEPTVE